MLPTLSAVSSYMFVIPRSRLLGVDYRVFTVGVDSRLYLSVAVVCYWLSGVNCQMLTVDCRLYSICRWLLFVHGCRVSVAGSWSLIVCVGSGFRFSLLMPTSGHSILTL